MRVHFEFFREQNQLWKFKGWNCGAERLYVVDSITLMQAEPERNVMRLYRTLNPEVFVLPKFYGRARETYVTTAPFTCNAGHLAVYQWKRCFSKFDGLLIAFAIYRSFSTETMARLYKRLGMGNPEWDRVYPFDPAFKGTVFSEALLFAYLERDDAMRPVYTNALFLPQKTEFSEEVHRRLVMDALEKYPDVVCIKAHGSGTRENDEKEAKLYSGLDLPVVALKHRFNHTRMATIVEDFYLAVRLAEGVLPGSRTQTSILPQLVLEDRAVNVSDRFKFLAFAAGFLGSYSVVVWEVDRSRLLEDVRQGHITLQELP